MDKVTVAKLKRVLAAGDPPLVGTAPVYDRRTTEINGKVTEQVQVLYLGSMVWINVNPDDVVASGWDPHDCM